MILVCDRCATERAASVREAVLQRGYPCALAALPEIANLHPFKIMITFADVYDELAPMCDGTYVIVIGEDFASYALSVKRVENVRAVLREIRFSIESIYGITESKKSTFGFSLTPSLFLANDFFTVNGNVVEPTSSEYMIFKYLTAFAGADVYFSAEMIARFCLPYARAEKSAQSVTVHIANLNKKIASVYGEKIIRSKRSCGYYAAKI